MSALRTTAASPRSTFDPSPCGHDAPMYGRYPTHEDQNGHGTAAIRTPTHALSLTARSLSFAAQRGLSHPTAPIAVGQAFHLLTCAHAARSGLHYQQAVRVNGGGLVRTAGSGVLLVCRCFLQGVEPGLKCPDFVPLRGDFLLSCGQCHNLVLQVVNC